MGKNRKIGSGETARGAEGDCKHSQAKGPGHDDTLQLKTHVPLKIGSVCFLLIVLRRHKTHHRFVPLLFSLP